MLSSIMQRASAGNLLDPIVTPPPVTTVEFGCRIPRSQLEVITPAQAANRADLSGTLITGPIGAANSRTGTDFIVEARGGTGALVGAASGNNGSIFEWVTISGLELDENGDPVRLHEVDRLVLGSSLTIRNAEIMWGNDGFGIGSNSRLYDSKIHSHATYTNTSATTQHRDGAQMQQGGGQEIVGCHFYNNASPWPLLPSGEQVPSLEARPIGASSAFIINHDRYITGGIKFNYNRSWGGTSVMFNMVGGNKPTTQDPYPDGLEWYVPREGDTELRIEVLGNICEEVPQNGIMSADRGWVRGGVPFPNNTDWSFDNHDMGASPAFSVRAPDGSLRNVRRGEIIG